MGGLIGLPSPSRHFDNDGQSSGFGCDDETYDRHKVDNRLFPERRLRRATAYATVYLWRPILILHGDIPARAGHISLNLPDNTYISFWPNEDNKLSSGSSSKTFQEDVAAEGSKPDDTLEIPVDLIDVEKVKSAWNEIRQTSYSFGVNNCATTIKYVLKAGANSKFNISSLAATDPVYIYNQIDSAVSEGASSLEILVSAWNPIDNALNMFN